MKDGKKTRHVLMEELRDRRRDLRRAKGAFREALEELLALVAPGDPMREAINAKIRRVDKLVTVAPDVIQADGRKIDHVSLDEALVQMDETVTDVERTNTTRFPLKAVVHDRWKRDLRAGMTALQAVLGKR